MSYSVQFKFTNKKLTPETEKRDIQISLTDGDRPTHL